MPDSESRISTTNMEKTKINLEASQPLLARNSALTAVLLVASLGAWAQDSSTTSVRHGEPTFETNVQNAEIVYVEGNDLEARVGSKLPNGFRPVVIVQGSSYSF
jgi:hypothetical protein